MYRLLSAVPAQAATRRVWAWGHGQRGVHRRATLPQLGPGWVGGLGLGLGLALGVKLAGGLRGATPVPSPAAPDPEASPQSERPPPPLEESLAGWSPQTPAPPTSRRFARAIDSSRDLLHRIKVRRRGNLPEATGNPAPHPGHHPGPPPGSSPRAEWTPLRAMGCPRSASEKDFPFSDVPASVRRSWGLPKAGRRSPPFSGTAPCQPGCQPGTPLTVSARTSPSRCGRGPGGEGGAKPGAWSRWER